jgi:hypothetical protein
MKPIEMLGTNWKPSGKKHFTLLKEIFNENKNASTIKCLENYENIILDHCKSYENDEHYLLIAHLYDIELNEIKEMLRFCENERFTLFINPKDVPQYHENTTPVAYVKIKSGAIL